MVWSEKSRYGGISAWGNRRPETISGQRLRSPPFLDHLRAEERKQSKNYQNNSRPGGGGVGMAAKIVDEKDDKADAKKHPADEAE